MKARMTTLYAFSPIWLLPLMDFSFGQIDDYLKGPEFRALIAEAITQLIAGVVDAALIGAIQQLFGVILV